MTETYVRTVPLGKQIAEGVVSGVFTLGHIITWEHSQTIVNVYLIDGTSGNVLWYDASMMEAGGEPEAMARLMGSVFERFP